MSEAPAFGIGSVTWPGLSKVVEEAGELTQVLGKLIATGGEVEHWDGTNLGDRLIEELGDLRAALDYFEAANGLNAARVDGRRKLKRDRFFKWHDEAGAALVTVAPIAGYWRCTRCSRLKDDIMENGCTVEACGPAPLEFVTP